MGGNIGWESERWRIRINSTFTHLREEDGYWGGTGPLALALYQVSPFWPEARTLADNSLYVDDNSINYHSLGVSYTNNPWQIQSEVSYSDFKANAFPSQMAAYLSLGYQVGKLTPFAVLASTKNEGDPIPIPQAPIIPAAPELNAQLAILQSSMELRNETFGLKQTSLSLGLRWDIRYDMALKAQWDHSRVGRQGGSLWDLRPPIDAERSINTFSINWNLVF